MPKSMTAPARLNLLVPWLNGNFDEEFFEGRNPEPMASRTNYLAIRTAISDFIRSFDGSAEAGHVEVVNSPRSVHAQEPTDADLGALEAHVRLLLEQGFNDGHSGDVSHLSFPVPSLRYAVRGAARRKPAKRVSLAGASVIEGGVAARRGYRAAGAYVVQVQGPSVELVPFLVAHLLTAPDMTTVKRCQRLGCDHFVVAATAARGRPRTFCSASCRVLNAEQLEQQRKQRGRKKR